MSRFSGGGVVAVSAVLAGVLYSSFWLELALPTGLDPIRAYASELFARDQPFRPLFAATEIASGALAIVAGALALTTGAAALPQAKRRLGRLAVILFGALTAADALLPMDCSVSGDPACARAEAAGELSIVHDLHSASSSLAVAAGLAGMVLLALSRVARVLAVAQLVVTASLLVIMLTGGPVGLVQRVQITLFSVWLITLGMSQALRHKSR